MQELVDAQRHYDVSYTAEASVLAQVLELKLELESAQDIVCELQVESKKDQ